MTHPDHGPSLGEAMRDAALVGLQLELQGLWAMFSVLTLAGGFGAQVGPGGTPEDAARPEMDNLPI